jgi:hypothetical protein
MVREFYPGKIRKSNQLSAISDQLSDDGYELMADC